MQKISFGNREYVRASEVAKRFKYTQDYVGQLCRGDKVDARLVGRVWYVNLDSVTEYRKTKHATQKKAAKSSAAPSDSKAKKRKVSKVEPVVRAKTARKLQERFPKEAKLAVQHIKPKYSRDKAATIPVVHSTEKQVHSVPQTKPNQPPRKVVIKVRPNTKKGTAFHAEERPEITLKSKLKVTDKFENFVPETPDSTVVSTETESSKIISTPKNKEESQIVSAVSKSREFAAVNFHPTSVNAVSNKKRSGAKLSRAHRFLPVVVCTAALIFGALILGLTYSNQTESLAGAGVQFDANTLLVNLLSLFQ